MVQCKHTATVYAFFRSGPLTITSTKLGLPEENTGPMIFLFTAHTSQVTTGDPYLALTMCSLSPKVLTYSLRKAISSVLYWNSLWALVTSWHRSFCWFLPLWPCAEGNPVLEDSVFRSGYSLPLFRCQAGIYVSSECNAYLLGCPPTLLWDRGHWLYLRVGHSAWGLLCVLWFCWSFDHPLTREVWHLFIKHRSWDWIESFTDVKHLS